MRSKQRLASDCAQRAEVSFGLCAASRGWLRIVRSEQRLASDCAQRGEVGFGLFPASRDWLQIA